MLRLNNLRLVIFILFFIFLRSTSILHSNLIKMLSCTHFFLYLFMILIQSTFVIKTKFQLLNGIRLTNIHLVSEKEGNF